MKRIISLMMVLVMMFSLASCSQKNETKEARDGYHIVTDCTGRVVEVPDNASHIAAMNGPTFEMCLCLGAADRVVLTKKPQTSNYPAALLAYPQVANIEGFNNVSPSAVVNIEDYLSRKIDLVLYYNNEAELKKFDNVGIAAVSPILSTSDITNIDECLGMSLDTYKDRSARSMKITAEALGGDALQRFEKWETYVNGIIDMLYERTKDIPDGERPTVYWGNTWGENILSSYVITNRAYEIKLAGGKALGPTAGGNFPEINEEQLFQWNPDIILVDNHGNSPDLVKEAVMTKEKYANLKAVQTSNVYRIPAGVFFLDKGSTTALMTLWLATILQPERFADISMTEELKKYYKEFYGYALSDEDANHILEGWYYSSGMDEG
ncbi:MAG: ABC transporter substrate-binding protein [Clostridia bacterium]|nr:ABC transporter substrate-binding protein [Clostridia bacterium]